MKKIILLSTLLLAVGSAGAKERMQTEMKSIAAKALRQQAIVQSPMRKVQAEAIQRSLRELLATPELKMFTAEGMGTVIVSRDDMFEEVLGVSESEMTADRLPDNFRWWMETTDKTLQRRRAQGYPALLTRAESGVQPTNVANFVKTKWGQSEPFNSLCPDVSGQHCLTGCVATAMAQIFRYYKYPEQLDGSTGYSYTVNGQAKRSRLWASAPYDWSNMSNNYNSNYSDVQSKAVGALMRDCGYSVHMSYYLGASGAMSYNVPPAAAANFGYDEMQVACLFRALYTETEWKDMLYSELASRNPILYSGATADGSGHAFLFTGMQLSGKVYVNWGWAGELDGFFNIDYLEPDGDGSNYAAQGVDMTLGFRPHPAEEGEMRGRYARSIFYVQSPSAQADDENHLIVGFNALTNYGQLEMDGDLYYKLENVAAPSATLVRRLVNEPVPSLMGLGATYTDFTPRIQAAGLPAGNYRLAIYSQATNEELPSPARTVGGVWVAEVELDADGLVVSSSKMDPDEAAAATAITAPLATKKTITGTYNLAGQHVSHTTRGLIIRDGKKFIRK